MGKSRLERGHADLGAAEAAALIAARELSPVDLLESCIARVEAVDHAVNAMPTRDFDAARRSAAACARDLATRGRVDRPLLGLPLGVKDLEATAGLRTTYGSVAFRDHVPDSDSALVAMLRSAGAVVLGKTNTPERGVGANTRNAVHGATGNPFDPARTVAGSSGGSAAALACGMVPIATGSDMGGSLRNPAAYCGVVGFRPSPGVVPYPERVPLLSPLTVLGPMARSVADVRLLLSAMAPGPGRAPGDGLAPGIGLPDVRAAFSSDLGTAPIARDIRATFEARSGRIRGLFGSVGWDHPDSDGAHKAFDVLRAVDFLARDLSAYRADPGAISPLMRANVESALRLTAADVAAAHVAQTSLASRWRTFFERWDILVTPSMALSPGPWSELAPSSVDGVGMANYFHWLALAYIPTLVGHPAVSIPAGRDGTGMPFGLQLVGRPGGDYALLAIAEQVERAMSGDPDTSRPLPDLDALAAAPPLSGSPFFMGYGQPERPGPER